MEMRGAKGGGASIRLGQHAGEALGVKAGQLGEQGRIEVSGKGQRSACHRGEAIAVTPEGL